MAGMNQVARLSALTAIRRVTGRALMLQPGKALPERAFEERDLIDVPAQALADFGCEAGLAAHDEDGADPLLQELDPLGHGRRRHVQLLGRPFETTGPHHGREG